MSEAKRLTIAEAMIRIKLYENRIRAYLRDAAFVKIRKTGSEKIDGFSVEAYENLLVENYNRINGMIQEVNAIRGAIARANAKTEIMLGDHKMLLAEGINYRQNVQLQKKLLRTMQGQYSQAKAEIDMKNSSELDDHVRMFVSSVYGTGSTFTPEAISESIEAFCEANTYELIDPLHLGEKIDQMQIEVDELEVCLENEIKKANMLTTIEYTV